VTANQLRVGLGGGIGSGKSAVAEFFAQWGATIIDSDLLAREAVAPGSDGLAAIAAIWPQTLDAHGSLDRAALAAIVFADDAARAQLNAIVHPRVRALGAQREAAASAGLVVHVVPLLFETDFWQRCERTVVVIAPLDVRLNRVIARDHVGRDDVERRMAAQIDPADARARADYAIENDGDLTLLRERSRGVFDALLRDLDAKESP
jgi:dephospho-CoA kinase